MNYYYDEIVVGSSLRAVLFAAKHQLPIYFSKADRPHQFDMFSPEQDLSCFHLVNETKVWEGHGFSETWGTRKEILWERLIFLHSLKGLVPFSDFCESIRITDNTLTGFSEYAKLHSVDFGRCFYFDPQNIYQLLPESTKSKPKTYDIYDRVAFRRGGKHEIDIIKTEHELSQKIWFYPSPRIDGRTLVKDACSVSILSEDQIDDFDFSETITRLKMIEEMRNRGMRGPQNGYQISGAPRHRSFKTEAINREKYLSSSPVWVETDQIKAPKVKEQTLLKSLPTIAKHYKRTLKWLKKDRI